MIAVEGEAQIVAQADTEAEVWAGFAVVLSVVVAAWDVLRAVAAVVQGVSAVARAGTEAAPVEPDVSQVAKVAFAAVLVCCQDVPAGSAIDQVAQAAQASFPVD